MSTRGRLTISYAILLVGTMVVFSAALWVGRSKTATQQLIANEAYRLADTVLVTIQAAQQENTRLSCPRRRVSPTRVFAGGESRRRGTPSRRRWPEGPSTCRP